MITRTLTSKLRHSIHNLRWTDITVCSSNTLLNNIRQGFSIMSFTTFHFHKENLTTSTWLISQIMRSFSWRVRPKLIHGDSWISCLRSQTTRSKRHILEPRYQACLRYLVVSYLLSLESPISCYVNTKASQLTNQWSKRSSPGRSPLKQTISHSIRKKMTNTAMIWSKRKLKRQYRSGMSSDTTSNNRFGLTWNQVAISGFAAAVARGSCLRTSVCTSKDWGSSIWR